MGFSGGGGGGGGAAGTGGKVGKFTGVGASTSIGDSAITDDGTTIAATEPVGVTLSSIGTTKTRGVTVANETASGSQVSPQVGGSSKHSGGTQHNWAIQNEPQSASRQIVRLLYGTGTTPPASTAWTLDTVDPNFGLTLGTAAFVTSNITGFRLAINGGGLKETGGGRAVFQSAAAGEPWEGLSSTSTGNTGARFQLTCDAGTPTAGRFFRIGYGSGTFTTEAFGISSATATRGHLFVNGVDLGWTVRNVAFADSPVTVAWGDRLNVDTSGGVVVCNLPTIPAVTSPRQIDCVITHVAGNAAVSAITVNAFSAADGTNKINGANSFSINVTGASIEICHDGDSTNSRVIGGRLL